MSLPSRTDDKDGIFTFAVLAKVIPILLLLIATVTKIIGALLDIVVVVAVAVPLPVWSHTIPLLAGAVFAKVVPVLLPVIAAITSVKLAGLDVVFIIAVSIASPVGTWTRPGLSGFLAIPTLIRRLLLGRVVVVVVVIDVSAVVNQSGVVLNH